MIKNIQTKIKNKPLIPLILIILVSTILTEIRLEKTLFASMDFQSASYLTGIIEQGSVSILLVLLIKRLGLMREAGFAKPQTWKSVLLIWPILIFSLMNGGTSPFDGTLTIDTGKPVLLMLFGLLYLSVGLVEEILFRGLALGLLLPKWGKSRKDIYLVVILLNIGFGLLHLINLVMGRRPLLSTIAQIVYGMFFGVFFAACFLRMKSIWPVIIGHSIFDLCGNLDDIAVGSTTFGGPVSEMTLQTAAITTLVTLPLFIYGLIILRKVEPIHEK
jgi:uncharacterized protein